MEAADFRRVHSYPGGVAIGLANLLTHLARGETALSVTMTAVSKAPSSRFRSSSGWRSELLNRR